MVQNENRCLRYNDNFDGIMEIGTGIEVGQRMKKKNVSNSISFEYSLVSTASLILTKYIDK